MALHPELVPVMKVCEAFGLTRDERLEWASLVLDANVSTFSNLAPYERHTLRAGAEGAAWMARMMQRRRESNRAKVTPVPIPESEEGNASDQAAQVRGA